MKSKFGALCASVALLAACGGGGSSSPPTGGGGETPAPSPSPTFNYTAFDSSTGDQRFQSACAPTRFENTSAFALDAQPFGSGLLFEYTAASQTWDITGDTYVLEFNPNDLRPNQPDNVQLFVRQIASGALQVFILAKPEIDNGIAEYVRYAIISAQRFDRTDRLYRCLIGVPTQSGDQFAPGSREYRSFTFGGTAFVERTDGSREEYSISALNPQLAIDRATDSLNLQVQIEGARINGPAATDGDPISFEAIAGSNDQDNNPGPFGGSLTNAANNRVGSYTGQFFGPQGSEIGLTMSAEFFLGDGAKVVVNATLVGANPNT